MAFAISMALVACGGGDGDSAPAAPAASLTLTGTAATGGAIAGAPVALKCVTGTGSGATVSDGTFSINIAGGALPCTVEVTTSDGTKLHSLATGSGTTAVVNITPVTELIVASLAQVDPASFHAGFGASSASTVTPASVAGAESDVIGVLKAAGIDL